MRSFSVLFLTASISFVAGSISCVAGIWYLRNYLANLAPNIYTVGLLEYQNPPDPSASVTPPEGYYISSTATERIYINHDSASSYVGRQIRSYGKLSTKCGSDGMACYPIITAKSINVVK